jgi:cobalt-precorrin 5A hydrolase
VNDYQKIKPFRKWSGGKEKKGGYAIWAITAPGIRLARRIMKGLDVVHLYLPGRLANDELRCFRFESLKAEVAHLFNQYCGHIFIMATGIVVRMIAPLIKDKTVDPAVVVLDDKGSHCISLLSGHLGGANELAREVARIVQAVPVITTATDTNDVPSIDLIAKELGLAIENPGIIKSVNMALLEGETIEVFDPYGILKDSLKDNAVDFQNHPPLLNGGGGDFIGHDNHEFILNSTALPLKGEALGGGKNQPMIYVGDEIKELPPACLVLRPRILVAGIGCNRGARKEEIKDFLCNVFQKHKLSVKSLYRLATIDIKKDEVGLIKLAEELGLPIMFYSSEELNRIKGLQNPSKLVEKHTGVESVCEGASLLGAKTSRLLVPKHVAKNVTVAVARTACT